MSWSLHLKKPANFNSPICSPNCRRTLSGFTPWDIKEALAASCNRLMGI